MRNWAVLVLLSTMGLVAWAAAPVATVSSAEDFSLKGAPAPVAGVPSYPVMLGDEVQSGNASTVLRFKDGSKVTLAPHSRARVEESDSHLAVRLIMGGGGYSFSQGTSLRLFAGSQAVPTPSTSGQFALQSTASSVTIPSIRFSESTLAIKPPAISRRRR